jgi:tRNA (cmo5U34)-methyltransferase
LRQLAPSWLKEDSQTLDLGCGGGNYTLTLLEAINPLNCTLLDLSVPMLQRAKQRVASMNRGRVHVVAGDMRDVVLPSAQFDLIVTGATLHHLRDEADWQRMFARLATWLKPGGVLFVSDLVTCDDTAAQNALWTRYGSYLAGLGGGSAYRDKVFAYVDREDSPRSLPFQFSLLREAGFSAPDVLHRNAVFATYFARKS